MSKGGPVSEDEEKAIVEALESGKSTRFVARDFDRAQSTISDIVLRNGLDLAGRSAVKNATIAKSNYASIDRILVISECIAKGRELMAACEAPRDFQYIMTGLAIAFDKRRLEEGPSGEKAGEIKQLFDRMEDEVAAENVANDTTD